MFTIPSVNDLLEQYYTNSKEKGMYLKVNNPDNTQNAYCSKID